MTGFSTDVLIACVAMLGLVFSVVSWTTGSAWSARGQVAAQVAAVEKAVVAFIDGLRKETEARIEAVRAEISKDRHGADNRLQVLTARFDLDINSIRQTMVAKDELREIVARLTQQMERYETKTEMLSSKVDDAFRKTGEKLTSLEAQLLIFTETIKRARKQNPGEDDA